MGEAGVSYEPVRPYFLSAPDYVEFRPKLNHHTFVSPDGADLRVSGLSWFNLIDRLHAGDDCDAILARYQAAANGRINWLRWMLTKPAFPGFPGWTAPPVEFLPYAYAWCHQRGITPYVSLVTEVHADLSWLPPYLEMLRSLGVQPVEGVNEPDARKNSVESVEAQGLLSLPFVTNGYYDPANKWHSTGPLFDVHPDRKTDTGESPWSTVGEHFDMASQAKTAWEVYGGWDTPPNPFAGCHSGCLMGEPGKPVDFGNDLRAIRQFYQGCSMMAAGAIVHTLNSQFGWDLGAEEEAVSVAFDALHTFPVSAPNLAAQFVHDTVDEARTHAMNTYRYGSYVCRFGGQLIAPEVEGA